MPRRRKPRRLQNSFHVRKDVAPLKPETRGEFQAKNSCFHVRKDVAPLKLCDSINKSEYIAFVSTFGRTWLH